MKLPRYHNIPIIPFKLFFVLTQLNKFRQAGQEEQVEQFRVSGPKNYRIFSFYAIFFRPVDPLHPRSFTSCTRSLNQPVNPSTLSILLIYFFGASNFSLNVPESSRTLNNRDYCAEEKKCRKRMQKAELLYKVNLFFYRMSPLLPGQANYHMQISLFIKSILSRNQMKERPNEKLLTFEKLPTSGTKSGISLILTQLASSTR